MGDRLAHSGFLGAGGSDAAMLSAAATSPSVSMRIDCTPMAMIEARPAAEGKRGRQAGMRLSRLRVKIDRF
jgi:hypothetical protein